MRRVAAGMVALSLVGGMLGVSAREAEADVPPVGFGVHTDFSTGADPASMAVGDLNGDTSPDLVTVSSSATGVSVLLGNGSGGFGANSVFPGGDYGVAMGDLNRDTHLDLVATNFYSNTVSVLLGNGSGGFGPTVDVGTVSSPVSVAVGDLNGDTRLDLVIADYTASGRVSVLLGDGSGRFGAATQVVTGDLPRSVAVADVNGDTFPDLVTANQGSTNSVSVLLGDGSGGFGTKTDYATGSGTRSLAISDLNGDSFPDVAAANTNTNNVSVLLGNGSGGFGTNMDFATASAPWPIVVSDLNGDAHADLAVGAASAASVLLNITGMPIAPSAPTILNATSKNASATVSWNPPDSAGGSPITGYVVTPYIGGIAQAPVTFNFTATTQTVTGLTNGTTYTFTVAAINAFGIGSESGPSNAVTPAPTSPSSPTILRNATAADQSATVSWLAPASDGGSQIVGYVVTPYVGYVTQGPRYFVSTATTQTVPGLTNGTTYRFRVRAWNAIGVSGFSTVTNPVTPTP